MALTITTNSGAIYLTTASENPLSIVSGVTVSANFVAVYGNSSQAWTITNQGSILATGTITSPAVRLVHGGLVTNSGISARIAGWSYGVYFSLLAGSVTNQGTDFRDVQEWGVPPRRRHGEQQRHLGQHRRRAVTASSLTTPRAPS